MAKSVRLTPANRSPPPVSITATASVTGTLHERSICGSSDPPGWRTITRLNTAVGAASIPSPILPHRDTRPGYGMALFTSSKAYVTPLRVTGGNGPPVATSPRTSVRAIRSAGGASACARELESVKMMGLSLYADALTVRARRCAKKHVPYHTSCHLGQAHQMSIPAVFPNFARIVRLHAR